MENKTKRCLRCDKEFIYVQKRARFCSKNCAVCVLKKSRYVSKKTVVGQRLPCAYINCNSLVYNYPADIIQKRKRFCSKVCSNASKMTNVPVICAICEVAFYCSKSQLKYRNRSTCSRKCQSIKKTRDAERRNRENPPTQGVLNRRIRYSKAMREWRKAVFERDDFTCQFCGKRGGALQADHIKSFAEYPELRTVLSNGRTLCVDCHRKTETWGVKKKIVLVESA